MLIALWLIIAFWLGCYDFRLAFLASPLRCISLCPYGDSVQWFVGNWSNPVCSLNATNWQSAHTRKNKVSSIGSAAPSLIQIKLTSQIISQISKLSEHLKMKPYITLDCSKISSLYTWRQTHISESSMLKLLRQTRSFPVAFTIFSMSPLRKLWQWCLLLG